MATDQYSILLELSKLRVADVLAATPSRKLITVNTDTTHKDAFQTICENHIHCVPVLRQSEIGDDDEVCIGLLDLRDFVSYLVSLMTEESASPVFDTALALQNFSLTNRFQPVFPETSLTVALAMFAKEKSLHRLPVLQSGSSPSEPVITHMLSFSSLMQYLVSQKHELLHDFWRTPMTEFADSVYKDKVISSRTTDTLLDALKTFIDQGINAMPIVRDDDTILGSISVSDVQFGVLLNLNRLKDSLATFLIEASRNAEHQFDDQAVIRISNQPVYIDAGRPFGEAIDLMVEQQVSHVWVVDEDKRPIGVIAGYDVIGALATYLLSTVITI